MIIVFPYESGRIKALSSSYVAFAGMYWIDPNGGAKEDAVLALCDFKKHTTCIKPSKTTVRKGLGPRWLLHVFINF